MSASLHSVAITLCVSFLLLPACADKQKQETNVSSVDVLLYQFESIFEDNTYTSNERGVAYTNNNRDKIRFTLEHQNKDSGWLPYYQIDVNGTAASGAAQIVATKLIYENGQRLETTDAEIAVSFQNNRVSRREIIFADKPSQRTEVNFNYTEGGLLQSLSVKDIDDKGSEKLFTSTTREIKNGVIQTETHLTASFLTEGEFRKTEVSHSYNEDGLDTSISTHFDETGIETSKDKIIHHYADGLRRETVNYVWNYSLMDWSQSGLIAYEYDNKHLSTITFYESCQEADKSRCTDNREHVQFIYNEQNYVKAIKHYRYEAVIQTQYAVSSTDFNACPISVDYNNDMTETYFIFTDGGNACAPAANPLYTQLFAMPYWDVF